MIVSIYMKVFGSGLIVLTSGIIGIKMSEKLSSHERILKLLMLMTDRISTFIEYQAMRTGEIINELAGDEGFGELKFLKEADRLYSEKNNFHDAWEEAVSADKDICQPEKNELILLGSELGKSNIKGQISMLKIHCENIKNIYESVCRENENKGRLYRSLGVLTGVFISVMFI